MGSGRTCGDEQAFARYLKETGRGLTRNSEPIFRDRGENRECVQQSLRKAYFSLKEFRGERTIIFGLDYTDRKVKVWYDEIRRRRAVPRAVLRYGQGLERSVANLTRLQENHLPNRHWRGRTRRKGPLGAQSGRSDRHDPCLFEE